MTQETFEDFLITVGPMSVINLPYRNDRRTEFAAQLRKADVSFDHPWIKTFVAVRPDESAGFPTIGARGCFLSHLGVLREALATGQNSVLICEDDLDFTSDMLNRLPNLTYGLKRQLWSIFYGGYQLPPNGEAIASGLLKVDPESSITYAHFYAVQGPAIADLVSYLEAILTRPPGDPEGGPMHVDGAISRFRADHPNYITLVTTPPIGVQRSSRTDIHALSWFDQLPVIRDLVGLLRRLRTRTRRQ